MPEALSTTNVPYQAYKSKRNSRNVSNNAHLVPNVSPPTTVTVSRPVLNEKEAEPAPVIILDPSPPAKPVDLPVPEPASSSKPPQKRASTFRHVPRTRPSPLNPNQTHSRNVSVSSTVSTTPRHSLVLDFDQPRSRMTSFSSYDQRSPPPDDRQQSTPPVTPPQRSSSLQPPSSPPQRPSPSTSPAPKPQPSSPTPKHPPPTHRPSAPYRPGFQPKGVYRPRTDEFLTLRQVARDGDPSSGMQKRIERTKLERRLEKLIALHFPPPGQAPPPMNRRASSIFDFDLADIRRISMSDASGLWKNVLSSGGKDDIRAAEQRITPWQEDSTVSKCPLCSASFHPLTNRKHHCRLCGNIICSLPVKRPQRPLPCSGLFVVDPQTRKIEEVVEGVDYGVKKRKGGSIGNANDMKTAQQLEDEAEKFLKGVRICKDCRPVLLREQYQQEIVAVPTFAKLYEAFVALEKELEELLPQFQELIMSLTQDEHPTKEASAARKRLLENFAQYDALAKRIRKLPCPPGSSQDRVQTAVLTRANLFLQKHMFPLQSLPKPKRASQAMEEPTQNSQLVDPDSEVAMALQPLLEQEALLESFVEEAQAHRKFEDAKTLRTNLKEIRAEIDKIMANAEVGKKNGS